MRLKGFTIIELLVVMVMSAIVVAGVWYSITTVVALMSRHQRQSAVVLEQVSARVVVLRDVFASDSILQWDSNYFLRHRDKQVEYAFSDTLLVRNNKDTLLINSANFRYYLQDELISRTAWDYLLPGNSNYH